MAADLKATISQETADNMLKCTHKEITFHGHVMINLDFSERDLSGVYFAGIWIENTKFANSKCIKTSFYGSFLENIDFSGADLSKTIFREAKVNNCNFTNIKAPSWKKLYLWLKNS